MIRVHNKIILIREITTSVLTLRSSVEDCRVAPGGNEPEESAFYTVGLRSARSRKNGDDTHW